MEPHNEETNFSKIFDNSYEVQWNSSSEDEREDNLSSLPPNDSIKMNPSFFSSSKSVMLNIPEKTMHNTRNFQSAINHPKN